MILFSVGFWLFLFNSLLTMCLIFSGEPLSHLLPLRNLLEVFFFCLHSSFLSISFLLYFNPSYGVFIETTEYDCSLILYFGLESLVLNLHCLYFLIKIHIFIYQNTHIFICTMCMWSPPYVGVAFKITRQIVA